MRLRMAHFKCHRCTPTARFECHRFPSARMLKPRYEVHRFSGHHSPPWPPRRCAPHKCTAAWVRDDQPNCRVVSHLLLQEARVSRPQGSHGAATPKAHHGPDHSADSNRSSLQITCRCAVAHHRHPLRVRVVPRWLPFFHICRPSPLLACSLVCFVRVALTRHACALSCRCVRRVGCPLSLFEP